MKLTIEKESTKSLNETIASLKENLAQHRYGVLFELDMKQKLNEKGIEFVDEYIIFDVCSPTQAKKLLDQDPQAGYALPCKMVVRQQHNKTYVGLTNPEALFEPFGKSAIREVASKVKDDLVQVINQTIE